MLRTPRCPRARAALAGLLLFLVLCSAVEAAGPKRVLILHSFGREFAPFDTVSAVFRTELAQRYPDPIAFIDASLDLRRGASEREERVFLDYLAGRFDSGPPDVVVTIGIPAARFYTRHRDGLFATTPLVVGSLDERNAKSLTLRPGDAVAAANIDLSKIVDNIVGLLPNTKTIAVVLGASDIERFWAEEMKREFAAYRDRVKFEYFNALSLTQMQQRAADLPPDSAILYALLVMDAAGVPHERYEAMARLHAVANAPIFGIFESEIGRGIVGGPNISQRKNGQRIATVVLRLFDGKEAPRSEFHVDTFERPVYDWRELVRWNIDPARLPAESEIRFKPPSLWDEHRAAVIGVATALLLQAGLIAAMLIQRARRRRAELEAEALAGRLVTAYEDERRRLARELHDDVSQRLAGLAIEAAELEHRHRGAEDAQAAHAIRAGLAELGEDIHTLSYRLHPSVIEDLGLAEALRIERDRVAQQGALQVRLDCDGLPERLPADAALCLFRVAQEALRNVERHARATLVTVRVAPEAGGIALMVCDDGAGFDATAGRARASLGLASMRERVRLQGGRLDIESAPGQGTTVGAWIPLREAA